MNCQLAAYIGDSDLNKLLLDAIKEQEPLYGLVDDMHAIRIRIHFLNNDQENFRKQITDYVASNKRSSNLYQETN